MEDVDYDAIILIFCHFVIQIIPPIDFFLEIPSHNSETCSPTAPQSAVTALK